MQRYALEREVWTAELGWIYMDVNPSVWSGSYFLLESYRAFSASRGVLGDARGAGQATPLARVWVGEYRAAMSLRARVRDDELARYMDVPIPRFRRLRSGPYQRHPQRQRPPFQRQQNLQISLNYLRHHTKQLLPFPVNGDLHPMLRCVAKSLHPGEIG